MVVRFLIFMKRVRDQALKHTVCVCVCVCVCVFVCVSPCRQEKYNWYLFIDTAENENVSHNSNRY